MNDLNKNERIARAKAAHFATVEPLKLEEFRIQNEQKYIGKKASNRPLISIYTPTYNRSELLINRAVKSVLKQTYDNFEYIIIGDCCSDNTAEMLEKIDDPRIQFLNIPKRSYRYPPVGINHWLAGPVTAANLALSLVKGDWIARLDDDDIWTEDHLELLLDFALKGDFEFVSGAVEAMNDAGEIELRGSNHPVWNLREYLKSESEFDTSGETLASNQSTWLYRSYLSYMKYNIDCWRKNHNRVNDTDLLERMYKIGIRMGFLDKKVMSYFPRPNEQMGSKAFIDNPDIEEKYCFS